MENLNDPWSTQKAKSVHFYKEVFNKDISFEGVKIPEYTKEFSVLGYIDRSITGRTMLQVYREFFNFGSGSPVHNNDFSENEFFTNLDKLIRKQQMRPSGNYAFAHVGGIEPEGIHLNKSYNTFCNDGNNHMIPIEGVMYALQYRFENHDMIDVKYSTLYHALDIKSRVIYMSAFNGQLGLFWGDRGKAIPSYGYRQIKLAA